MQPRIRQWMCHYRVFEAQPEARTTVDFLEHAVRSRVIENYERFLGKAFEKDPIVYVLRRLHVPLLLHTSQTPAEKQLAAVWASNICKGVIESISIEGNSDNVARFDSEAEYIAHFVADLIGDRAWLRWYYGAFSKYRTVSKLEATTQLLIENRPQLNEIFRCLARLGCLRAVLDMLDSRASAKLWSEAIQPQARAPNPSEFRIVVQSAFLIASWLKIEWADDQEKTLASYLASRPPLPDWTDRRSLSSAVLNVLRFGVQDRMLILRSSIPDVVFPTELRSSLDWLDVPWLEAQLRLWLVDSQAGAPVSLPQGSSRTALSSKLQRLLERLRELLCSGALTLDSKRPDAESNALRIYAAISVAESNGQPDASTANIIGRILTAWRLLLRSTTPLALLQELREGGVEEWLRNASAADAEAMRSIARLGAAVADVLSALQTSSLEDSLREAQSIQSSCAGLFLLVRAVEEARLPQIAKANDVALEPILLALGLMWSGPIALQDDKMDSGLALWCGAKDSPLPPDIMGTITESSCIKIHEAVLGLWRERVAIESALAVEDFVLDQWCTELVQPLPTALRLNPALSITAVYLLRLWAWWLPGVGSSSVPYLLNNLARRSGSIEVSARRVRVRLRPAPLDIVLEMSGYAGETPPVSWLGDRHVSLAFDRKTS